MATPAGRPVDITAPAGTESDYPVLVDVVDGVATVVLNRPRQLNAITVALADGLDQALVTLGDRPDVSVVVVRGAGGNLSAGGDIDEVDRLRAQGPSSLMVLFESFGRALARIATLRQPVVVVLEGVATAGGFELVQAADIVLVHEHARVRDNHVRFGWIPGGGSTQRLPRILGRQAALGHLLSGETLSAADLVTTGLAHRALEAGSFEDEVARFVGQLARRDPAAVARIKALVGRSFETDLAQGLAEERSAVVDLISGSAGETGLERLADRSARSEPRDATPGS